MPGYYPMMPMREPVGMVQVYPPVRSYSLAKLNQGRDYEIYEKVKVNKSKNGDWRPQRMFEQLRRQQSYEGDSNHKMHQSQPRRPDGFDSLQLLGAKSDDRYLERFMESSRGRPASREHEPSKNKNTLLSNKSNSSSKSSSSSKKDNKENKKGVISISTEIMALLGSLKHSASVDNIYESVEQIHYRKSMELLKRREKVRSVHRTGHPLFDHLREERAMASGNDEKTANKRISRSAGPSRKTSVHSSPNYSSPSSGDEQEYVVHRSKVPAARSAMTLQHQHHQQRHIVPSFRRTGSAGSESDDEWVIPRPKIGGRHREIRAPSTDESDSSSKSSPIR